MKERTKRGTQLRRMIVVLALGVAIGTMIVATPASAHFRSSIDHIWSHIKPKADARYSRVLVMQAGSQTFSQTSYTAIASGTFRAPGKCALVMDGTLDWDDNSTANILFIQWHVDGVPVGGDFAYQGGGTGNNLAASATASKVVTAGSHNVELRALVSSGSADLEDIGAYAFCGFQSGSGAVVTSTSSGRSPSGASSADSTR